MNMVGLRVKHYQHGLGTVVRHEPFSQASDVLVRFDCGRLPHCAIIGRHPEDGGHLAINWIQLIPGWECWIESRHLRYLDGMKLRDRSAIIRDREQEMLQQLRGIRANLIRDWRQPWPGCDFGKAIMGRGIDAAIKDIEDRS